jgi:hypothetical protein
VTPVGSRECDGFCPSGRPRLRFAGRVRTRPANLKRPPTVAMLPTTALDNPEKRVGCVAQSAGGRASPRGQAGLAARAGLPRRAGGLVAQRCSEAGGSEFDGRRLGFRCLCGSKSAIRGTEA